MRILNQKDLEITQPDLTVGRLIPDKHFVCHHEAVQEVAEQFHLEVKETYANGGHDMKKVIDVAYVPPQDAWDEYEDILRYVPFTAAEQAERNKPDKLALFLETLTVAEQPQLSAEHEAQPYYNPENHAIEWNVIQKE